MKHHRTDTARLEDVEWQLNPTTDYRHSAGPGPDALDMLWATYHDSSGRRLQPEGEAEGEPVEDLRTGHLRPVTMSAVGDCLQDVASWVCHLIESVSELEDQVRKQAAPNGG